jgi:hypothetical protein
MAAWGNYDIRGSMQINAYHLFVLFVEWWGELSGHYSFWFYCDPKRPTEWIIGRERQTRECVEGE